MAVKNYGIHDKWTDLDKLNNVDIKSVDGVIESVKINGEEAGGGGGSSDFSTAEVTFVNPNTQYPTDVNGPFSVSQYNLSIGKVEITPETTETITIILYKGTAIIECNYVDSIDGAIEAGVEHRYSVTGNATVTFES